MNSESFGDISLADYRRMAGPRQRTLPRLLRIAVAIAACVLCTAAGDYTGLWSGKTKLKFEEGMYLLGHTSALEFQTEGGMGAVTLCIRDALDELARHAARDGKIGKYARAYLLNLAIRSTQLVEDTTTSEEEKARLERNLPRRSKEPK